MESACAIDKKLSLEKLAGLWIIIAGSIGGALVIELIDFYRTRSKFNKIKHFPTFSEADFFKDEIESYLMINDYIHIPSKDLHLHVVDDVKTRVEQIEEGMKERIKEIEKKVAGFVSSYEQTHPKITPE